MTDFIIPAILILFIFLYFFIENRRKSKRIAEISHYFRETLPSAINAISAWTSLTTNEKYFTMSMLTGWESANKKLINKEINLDELSESDLSDEEKNTIIRFLEIYNDRLKFRDQFNNLFAENEKNKYVKSFELIESNGKSINLGEAQKNAIVHDEDNSLVIAGAGCGKTKTILGKLNYLIDSKLAKSSEILLISFTKKSANDIKKEMPENISVEPITFHKLGLDIIKTVKREKVSVYDQSINEFMKKKIYSFIKEDDAFLDNLVIFFTEYYRIEKDPFEFETLSERVKHLKSQNFRPYQKVKKEYGGKITYNREIVKSQQECKIANYLLFNNIDYKYEAPYEYKTVDLNYRQYRPDFSLYQNGKRIYLEHYGIDRNGNVPPFFNKENPEMASFHYEEGMRWKRNLHEKKNTVCLETFHYNFKEGTIYKNLKKIITDAGFVIKPMTNQEKLEVIQSNAKDEFDSFITIVCTFLNLFKSNNITFNYLERKISALEGFEKNRTETFMTLFRPLYDSYEKNLIENQSIDFSDMINMATKFVIRNVYKKKYEYLLIDEFQDISKGRYDLIRAILNQNKGMKLFAVGDDWQSIYRFTGSDMSLFKNIGDYFGFTKMTKIETTFRFGEPIMSISGNFIQKNPNQIPKKLVSIKKKKDEISSTFALEPLKKQKRLTRDAFRKKSNLLTENSTQSIEDTKSELKFFVSKNSQDDTEGLKKAIDYVIKSQLNGRQATTELIKNIISKKYLVLGRYNFDINRINKIVKHPEFSIVRKERTVIINYQYNSLIKLSLEFLTCHRSKGLTKDFVFILNCNSGKIGFPSEIVDDPLTKLLLGEEDSYPNSEERRLFYVALTRAKEMTCCISSEKFKSKFIEELDIQKVGKSNICPNCKSGKLLTKSGTSKKGNQYRYHYCNGFLTYGCEYKVWDDLEEEEKTYDSDEDDDIFMF